MKRLWPVQERSCSAPHDESTYSEAWRGRSLLSKLPSVDLITLLSRNEGKTLEFKRDLSAPDGVLKAIVAFANTSGGVLVLGVEDGTKRVTGIRDDDRFRLE